MFLYEALKDIGSRANDPGLDNLRERALYHFFNAINEIIVEEKYTDDDLPGYTHGPTNVSFATNPYDLGALNCLHIANVYIGPGGSSLDVNVTLLKTKELTSMDNNSLLQPTDEDLFLYKTGHLLHALNSGVTSNFDLAVNVVKMIYIEDIDHKIFSDFEETELELTFADANPDTIVRTDGEDWDTDQIKVGQKININNSTNNDGTFTVDALDGDEITLVAADALTAGTETVNIGGTDMQATDNYLFSFRLVRMAIDIASKKLLEEDRL